MSSSSIIKQGYMTKEGSKIKSWKKRWFVFRQNGLLDYYKDQKLNEQKGTVELFKAIELRPTIEKKKIILEVVFAHKIFRIQFDNEEVRQEWYDCFNTFLKKLKNTGSSEKPKLEDFEYLKLIGKGTYGKVMLVKKILTEEIYAMKILDKKNIIETNEVEHTMAERDVLAKTDFPFVIKMHYSFQTDDKLYFIMDFVNGGEMFYHLQNERRFSITRAKFYAAEILLALEYLHKQGVIYRDLKPENVLLTDEGHICLTDFGLSKTGITNSSDKTSTFCGTAAYLAPEILLGEKYDINVDWWSFGILTYEMMVGIPPFYSEDEREMYQKIVNEPVKYPPNTPSAIVNFIDALLEKDIKKRLVDPEQMKQNPFFQGFDFNKLIRKEVTPPFIPNVSGKDDVSNIDGVFLEESAIEIEQEKVKGETQRSFQGFTYVKEDN